MKACPRHNKNMTNWNMTKTPMKKEQQQENKCKNDNDIPMIIMIQTCSIVCHSKRFTDTNINEMLQIY